MPRPAWGRKRLLSSEYSMIYATVQQHFWQRLILPSFVYSHHYLMSWLSYVARVVHSSRCTSGGRPRGRCDTACLLDHSDRTATGLASNACRAAQLPAERGAVRVGVTPSHLCFYIWFEDSDM